MNVQKVVFILILTFQALLNYRVIFFRLLLCSGQGILDGLGGPLRSARSRYSQCVQFAGDFPQAHPGDVSR